MSDHDLDRQIDLVARQMTAVAEDADFLARVTTRLPPPRRHPWFEWAWLPAGAVVVALFVGALFFTRPLPPRATSAASVPTPAAGDAMSGSRSIDAARDTGATASALVARAVRGPRERAIVEPSVPRLPALATPPLAPLVNIQPEPLSTPLLGVTPIATEPLVLAPLDGGKD